MASFTAGWSLPSPRPDLAARYRRPKRLGAIPLREGGEVARPVADQRKPPHITKFHGSSPKHVGDQRAASHSSAAWQTSTSLISKYSRFVRVTGTLLALTDKCVLGAPPPRRSLLKNINVISWPCASNAPWTLSPVCVASMLPRLRFGDWKPLFFSVALPFGPTKWGVINWQQSSRFPAQT